MSNNENKLKNSTEVQSESSETKQNEVDITKKHSSDTISRMSKAEMIHYMAELIIEIKKLRHIIDSHNSESQTFYDNYRSSVKQNERTEEQIDIIGKRISSTYTDLSNSGHMKGKTLEEKTNIIIQDIFNERKQNSEMFLEYEEKLKRNKIALDELRAHCLEAVKKQNESDSNDTATANSFTANDFAEFAGSHTEETKAEAIFSQQDSGEYVSTIRGFNKKDLIDSLDDYSRELIRIVGEEGLSEMPEISARANECNVPSSKIETLMGDLTSKKMIFESTPVTTMLRKGNGVRVYCLTNDIGKPLFKTLFKKDPVLSEKEKMIKENDNLSHGYSIKEIAKVLVERGYKNVSYDRAKNTLQIADRKVWIPDIVAYNLSDKPEYFEIEMVTTNPEDFNLKLEKANLRAKELKIVVPTTVKALQCKSKVQNWLSSKKRTEVSLDTYIYTAYQLKNKEDGIFIPAKETVVAREIEKAEKPLPKSTETNAKANDKVTEKTNNKTNKNNTPTISEEIVKDGD